MRNILNNKMVKDGIQTLTFKNKIEKIYKLGLAILSVFGLDSDSYKNPPKTMTKILAPTAAIF